ncbi:Hypothetical protein R9X50_00369600 [Acrodontium crateriforme]|uniref:Uncharacterized protein n=1 Tax=Acrodontium crateriforme TaxID=150365 RepID=A0AAQ3M3X7_9PEZI|nr:Hypothetical protein R9X50_00369600 [Acrodontium crateriforme]
MGFFDVIKALAFPALIALVLYALLAYALVPMIRTYRARYSQYLPIDSLSEQTATLRTRAADALTTFVLPSSTRWRRNTVDSIGEELDFGDEEGERMVGFDVGRPGGGVSGSRTSVRGIDSERRLSRELEEGFKDDSEDDSEDDGRR